MPEIKPLPEPAPPQLAGILGDNIRTFAELRRREEAERPLPQRIADHITDFAGSMGFVSLHLLLFGSWMVLNLRLFSWIEPWDPYPFFLLALIAAVEALFLSAFVLISQNRMAEISERRAELSLHFSLLAEHELTRLIELTDAIAKRLGIETQHDARLQESKQDIEPTHVIEELARAQNKTDT